MRIYPIQNDFTSGILTPRLWSRSDTQEYRSGLKDSENMIPTRQGPIETRNGTVFAQDMGDNYVRPFGFQLIPNNTTGEAFNALVSSNGKLIVSGAVGTVVNEELSNPDFSLNLDGWNKIFTNGLSSVSWSSGSAIVTPEKEFEGEVAGISQQLTLAGGTENTERTIKFTSSQPGGLLRITTKILIGTAQGLGDLAEASFFSNSGEITFNPSGAASFWVSFVCVNEEYIEREPGLPPEEYSYKRILSTSVFTSASGGQVEFNHPWSASDIQNLHVEMAPNENSMYFVCQNIAPQKLSYDLPTNAWSFDEVTFAAKPASWIAGSFPTTVAFFQGRSWWAGVQSKPQTFWASKPNDESSASNELENLTLGTTAADALEFTLSRSGRIQWIEGANNLVIGTTSGEFLINGSLGVIAPDDIFVAQQSAHGSATVNSRKVGNMVLFISGDGRKLLGTRYFEDQNQWRAQELNFTADSLTEGKRIIDIAYTRNPDPIIWCLLDDGSLIGCSYDPFNGVIGWHRHTIGFIQGICVTEKAGNSILSVTAQRVINGATATYLEEFGGDYLDSSVVIETTSNSITVPHLAGQTVQVKINDAQHPDVDLDENGNGTLTYFEQTASVGLVVQSFMTTLEPDLGSNAGTSMGFNKRFNNIVLRIFNSAYPLINGQRPPVRYPESPMNIREQNKTLDISVTNLGFSDGSVTVSQDLPYKLSVSGLFGTLEQSKIN